MLKFCEMKKIHQIEDIFPLTIIQTRHGKIVIFNADNDAEFIDSCQGDEEVQYDLLNWLSSNVFCPYGVGRSLYEAFQDYKMRLFNQNDVNLEK